MLWMSFDSAEVWEKESKLRLWSYSSGSTTLHMGIVVLCAES